MVKLSTKEFLTKVGLVVDKGGSVFLTFKHFNGRYSVKKSDKGPFKAIKAPNGTDIAQEVDTPMLLVHVSDGNKMKFSTMVTSKEFVSFNIGLKRLMKDKFTGFQKSR